MLTLTREATDAIEQILSTAGVPDGAGLRIAAVAPPSSHNGGPPTSHTLRVGLAEDALGDDEVIEEHGARVFVEEALAELLSDKVLDAEVVAERVHFTLAEQG